MSRSYKWLWVPLVFLLLGVMQPIMTYFLPDILKSAGNMPEGTVITMPTPSGAEVLAQTLSQYSTIGLLILVLSLMTIISGERQSGVAAMIFAKPVSFISYVSAKWVSMLSLTTVSFLLGYAGAWYYTVKLIGPVDIESAIWAGLFYLLWLWFTASVTMLISSILNRAAGTAVVTLGIMGLLTLSTSLFPRYFAWSPSGLSRLAAEWLQMGTPISNTAGIVVISAFCFAGALLGTMFSVKFRQSRV